MRQERTAKESGSIVKQMGEEMLTAVLYFGPILSSYCVAEKGVRVWWWVGVAERGWCGVIAFFFHRGLPLVAIESCYEGSWPNSTSVSPPQPTSDKAVLFLESRDGMLHPDLELKISQMLWGVYSRCTIIGRKEPRKASLPPPEASRFVKPIKRSDPSHPGPHAPTTRLSC